MEDQSSHTLHGASGDSRATPQTDAPSQDDSPTEVMVSLVPLSVDAATELAVDLLHKSRLMEAHLRACMFEIDLTDQQSRPYFQAWHDARCALVEMEHRVLDMWDGLTVAS